MPLASRVQPDGTSEEGQATLQGRSFCSHGPALRPASRAQAQGRSHDSSSGRLRGADNDPTIVACFGAPSPLQPSPATADVVQRFCTDCQTLFRDECGLLEHCCRARDGRFAHLAAWVTSFAWRQASTMRCDACTRTVSCLHSNCVMPGLELCHACTRTVSCMLSNCVMSALELSHVCTRTVSCLNSNRVMHALEPCIISWRLI